MKAESLEWIQSFASTPHMQRVFDHGEFGNILDYYRMNSFIYNCSSALLSFLAYPLENKDVLRVGCDLMNWFFLYDEHSDLMAPHEAQQLAALVLDAMRNPDRTRPAQECVVVEALRQ
ncbi:hypothetical protein C0992_006099 [Termitomyces sp. T32_za158]|nr:hypothetical protein C0992_006099 [Termitomyces sp. T32_za158]